MPHTCLCGKNISTRGPHHNSAERQQRHELLNDIIWRAVRRAGVQAIEEPIGLLRDDGKGLDGASLMPWSYVKWLAWDVIMLDTYADSHLTATSYTSQSTTRKTIKYVHENFGQGHWRQHLQFCRSMANISLHKSQNEYFALALPVCDVLVF